MNYNYGDLYNDISVDAAGLVHTKEFSLGAPVAQVAYAVCKADGSTAEAKVTVNLP